MRSRSSGATPIPVSVTVTTQRRPPSLVARTRTLATVRGELHRVVSRLSTTCLKRSSSASTSADARVDVERAGMSCCAARSRISESAVLERVADGEGRRFQLHLARLDLGQVEDLVEQLQQVLAGAPDVAEVLLLTLVELAEHPVQQHLGEADDGVERGAQLVRHAGQELRLVPARDLQLGASCCSSSRNSRALRMASADWLANVCSSSQVSSEKPPVRLPADHQGADDLALAEHRHGQQRPPAVVVQESADGGRARAAPGPPPRSGRRLQRGPADKRVDRSSILALPQLVEHAAWLVP